MKSRGTRKTSSGIRATKKTEALALWKIVNARMTLDNLNSHLQGLYAELGRATFEQHAKKGRTAGRRTPGFEELYARIEEMLKRKKRLEQDAGPRKKAL